MGGGWFDINMDAQVLVHFLTICYVCVLRGLLPPPPAPVVHKYMNEDIVGPINLELTIIWRISNNIWEIHKLRVKAFI